MSKTQLLTIILSSVLVFLIALGIVLSIIYNNMQATEKDEKPLDIRTELGESSYVGMPIAYSRIEEVNILSLIVKNKNGTFDLNRFPDENGEFWLGYDAGDGEGTKMIQYIPPIVGAEESFDYESLFAIEEDDGYGRMYMLSYLCSAVGTVYFQQRIDLPVLLETDSEEVKAEKTARRAELIREYGLGENATVVSFAYAERDGKGNVISENIHHVEIGGSPLNGNGYYYRVDGRDCIYYTGYDSFKYALMGFHSFIKGTLVAAGLPQDGVYEPLLTTDFKEWVNTMHESGDIVDGANVVAKGDLITPIKESATYLPENYPLGVSVAEREEISFDLTALKSHKDIARIKDALVGLGIEVDPDEGGYILENPIYITLLSDYAASEDMIIDFGDDDSVIYRYEITEIESILDHVDSDGKIRENVNTGTPVGASKLLRVKYNLYIGGERVNRAIPRSAVIDLDSAAIPAEAKAALGAASVGALASAIGFDVTYDKTNAASSTEQLIITDIVGIYNPDGSVASKIGDDSYVSIRYREKIAGKQSDVKSLTISMADISEGGKRGGMYDALIGREIGANLNITAYSDTYYYEALRSYTTYRITEIECFVTSELVVSFRFYNSSDRDPFYGESVYENTISGKNSLYGLNADNCNTVMRILGGLGDDTSQSSGLAGKTVAVGLTHSVMKKYGLYDYTIYYELPRGLYDKSEAGEAEETEGTSDFGWYGTLGFTLYISKPDPVTGMRYVGSDMYDLVAEIDASTFEFIDKSFAEFWARRNLIMVATEDIDLFEIDFNMTDLKGGYNFEIDKKTYFVGSVNGEGLIREEAFEGSVETDKFYVYITQDEGTTIETKLSEFLEKNGTTRTSVTDIYNTYMGNGESLFLPNSIETVGVSNWMLAYQILQRTTYQGTLTEEEQAKAYEGEAIMSIKIKLVNEAKNPFTYVYDFYRVSDRKVMVSTYKLGFNGEVATAKMSDFYLSTFSFKKMVNAFISVFNAEEVDGEIPYTDN